MTAVVREQVPMTDTGGACVLAPEQKDSIKSPNDHIMIVPDSVGKSDIATSGKKTPQDTAESTDMIDRHPHDNGPGSDGTQDSSDAGHQLTPNAENTSNGDSNFCQRKRDSIVSVASSTESGSHTRSRNSFTDTFRSRKSSGSGTASKFIVTKIGRKRHSDTSVATDYETRKSMWTNLIKDEGVWDDEDDDDEEEEKEGSVVRKLESCTKDFWISFYMTVQEKLYVLKNHPSILVITAIFLAALLFAGIFVVLKFADEQEKASRDEAQDLAFETGNWFSDTLDNALLPLFTLSQFVQQLEMFHTLPEEVGAAFGSGSLPLRPPIENGDYTHRNITGSSCADPEKIARFEEVASSIKRDAKMQGVLVNLQVAPAAVICYVYPLNNTEDFEHPIYLDNTNALGHDLLTDPERTFIAEATVPSDEVVIAGPLTLRQCPDCGAQVKTAFIARLAINALTDDQIITVKGVEYKKWGFAVALINWAELVDRSDINERFSMRGMQYQLTRTDRTYNDETKQVEVKVNVLAGEEDFELEEDNYVSVDLDTTNNLWNIKVGYEEGFESSWKNGAIAGVVLGAFLLSFMLMSIFIENQTHHDLLREMLPPRALRKIKKGQTCVEKYKIATVFFSDIVGYTTMSSEMSAIQVMKMLNEFYTEVDKIANKHNVCKIQTIGDAYMVTGGVPDRCLGPEGAQKVALFAIDCINFAENFRTSEGARVYIRAGINSGPLVAGVVGTKRPQYTVFGDTVNAAARMESTSEKMRIQCTDMTYRLLRDSKSQVFDMENRGGIEVKGKGRMNTWFINKAVEGGKQNQPIVSGQEDAGDRDNFHESDDNFALYDELE